MSKIYQRSHTITISLILKTTTHNFKTLLAHFLEIATFDINFVVSSFVQRNITENLVYSYFDFTKFSLEKKETEEN